MLPKKKRVNKDTFNSIMEKGSIIYGSFFVFRYIKQVENVGYAIVAPKSMAKTAVKRNSLRRKGYNILNLYDLKLGTGIFFYKKEGLKTKTEDLKKDIEILLKKAKIL